MNSLLHPFVTTWHLFISPRFGYHRILGFVYLLQWFAAFYFYFKDYSWYENCFLMWSLPVNGVIQSVTATYYFSFLPKKADPGYYSDKSALSYDFVKENIFFSTILMFQWLYYDSNIFTNFFKTGGYFALAIEYLFVFFPYFLRRLVPKTSFRDSMNNTTNKSLNNKEFYFVVTWVTKIFYVWAKHFIGFFMNYLRFLERVTPDQIYHMHLCLIFSAFATTVSMFLHTLKFKGYIGPKTSYLIYMASYLLTFYSFVRIGEVFFLHVDLVIITLVGVVINFFPSQWHYAYQVLVAMLLFYMRKNSVNMLTIEHFNANWKIVVSAVIGGAVLATMFGAKKGGDTKEDKEGVEVKSSRSTFAERNNYVKFGVVLVAFYFIMEYVVCGSCSE